MIFQQLSGRTAPAKGRARLASWESAALAMGIGMWDMHLQVMVDFRLPVPVAYQWPILPAAILVVLFAFAIAIFAVSRFTARKRGEEALRASQQGQVELAKQLEIERTRLIEAQAVGKVGSWEVEFPNLNITWTEQTHRIFETDPFTFHPKRPDFVNFIHPEDRAKVDAAFAASLEECASSKIEYRIVMADGRVKVLEEHWKVFQDEQGRTARLMGTCQDITERKHEEAVLRYSEEKYRVVVETASDAVVSIDESGIILLTNPATTAIFGYESSELRGQPLTTLMPEYLREFHKTGFSRYLDTGERHINWQGTELTGRRKGGEEFSIDVSFGEVTRDGRRVFTGFIRDIMERKQAQARLSEYEKVVESLEEMVMVLDREYRYRLVNGAYLARQGMRRDEIIGRRVDEVLNPGVFESIIKEKLDECFKGEVVRYETKYSFPMAGERDLAMSYFPVGGRTVERVACVAQDITERKRAEQALRESQEERARVTRAATIGELGTSIAHEISQPLTAVVADISASARYLAQQPPNLEEAGAALTMAIREANRAGDLIGRIRAMLRNTPPPLGPLDLSEVIQEVLALARVDLSTPGITLKTELASDVPAVLGDRIQLQQLLLNLIMNSVHAMSSVGDRPRALLIKSSQHPVGVLIQVQDSGNGVDPDRADRIFDPFFSTKPQGIGMGLAISRSIVEAHGGRLWVTPGSPCGAIFQFTLQKAEEQHERI